MEEEKIEFYNLLNDREKILLKDNLIKKEFKKGEMVRDSTKSCIGVFVPLEGKLRVSIISDEGREITLYYVKPYDTCIFSASCVLSNISFDVFIQAAEDTRGLLIPIRIFSQLQENNLKVKILALEITNERFSDVMWALQQLLFLPLQQRIVMFLYDEMINTKSEELKLTHEDIARNIGSSREVITRSLKVFSKLGILEIGRGRIKILDKKELISLMK